MKGIDPPFGPDIMSYKRGDTGGGGPHLYLFGGVNYIHYLCIDNVEEMSGWGNNTSWSVDSNLLYKKYKGPHH